MRDVSPAHLLDELLSSLCRLRQDFSIHTPRGMCTPSVTNLNNLKAVTLQEMLLHIDIFSSIWQCKFLTAAFKRKMSQVNPQDYRKV